MVRDASTLRPVSQIHVLVPPGLSPGIAAGLHPSRVSYRRLAVLIS